MPSKSDAQFRLDLDAARVWEERLAAWLRLRGWYVLPAYEFSGAGDKAPRLMAPPAGKDLVLPDLQCFRGGSFRWVECKWKRRASFYRKTGCLVTGIDLRLWRDYKQVQRVTGSRVLIAFLHQEEREIRCATLDDLEQIISHESHSAAMGAMLFFRYQEIPIWARLEALCSEEVA